MRFSVLALVLVFFVCSLSCSNGQSSFPNTINVTKTAGMKRIKGTKLFVSAPAIYQPIESMVRLQKDDNTYLTAIEIPNSNFKEYKSQLTREAIESKGAKIDIDKPVKYNGYDAIYFLGPSKKAGETKIGLAFGDETFAMVIGGVCQTADKAAINELNEIIRTSYYDKSVEFNPLELINFTFDESITGFKYATTMGNVFFYTPNGKADLDKSNDVPSTFQLFTIELPSFSNAKEFLDYTISRYSNQGIQVSNVKKQDIIIDGNNAYEVIMDATDASDKKNILYHLMIHKGTKAVLFTGADGEQGKWLDKFKATAQSIKM